MDFPEQTSLKQSDGSVGVDDKPLVVEFRNVSFKYPGTDNYVLKNVSVKFSPGSKIGIVGENGAGKSTFVNLLLRFYDVEEGEILLITLEEKEGEVAKISYQETLHPYYIGYIITGVMCVLFLVLGRKKRILPTNFFTSKAIPITISAITIKVIIPFKMLSQKFDDVRTFCALLPQVLIKRGSSPLYFDTISFRNKFIICLF